MQLKLELTAEEEICYWEFHQTLLQKPAVVIEEFDPQWLRIVCEVGIPVSKGMPKIWLLTSAETTERDNRNLTLAIEHGFPLELAQLDCDYWIFNEKVVDRVLSAGVKGYGIAFLHDFDIEQIDYKIQELLTGQIVHW